MKRKIVLFLLTLLASLSIVACTEKPKELDLESNTLQLEVGEVKEVAITMSDGIADKLKVTSSNASVATATIEGSTLKVTGVASGSAVIEVEAEGITVDDKTT